MTALRAAAGIAALSALAACADVNLDAGPGEARVFEPPRRVAGGPGLDVVLVRGNLYRLTRDERGGGTLATASLTPMFQTSPEPNAEDAGTAVRITCGRGGRDIAPGDHKVNVADNRQTWTFFGECT